MRMTIGHIISAHRTSIASRGKKKPFWVLFVNPHCICCLIGVSYKLYDAFRFDLCFVVDFTSDKRQTVRKYHNTAHLLGQSLSTDFLNGRHHSMLFIEWSYWMTAWMQCYVHHLMLEVATPTPRPLSGRGCHVLTWRSHGHSLVAYLWRHLRQTVVLPGKCTPDSVLTG